MLNAFSIGTSALQAGQNALNLIGQNLANATTPGYHRQAVNLEALTSNGSGTGVDVASVTRYTSSPTATALLQANANQSASTAQLATEQQAQTSLTAGGTSSSTSSTGSTISTGGIGDALTAFFNQITSLTSTPDDSSVRSTVVSAASTLANQLNSAASGLDNLRSSLGGQISQTVTQVNTLTTQIATLNGQIANVSPQDQKQGLANNLMDQRDELISQLSQQVDVHTVAQPNGIVNVLSTNGPLVLANKASSISLSSDSSGNFVATDSGTGQPISFESGTLAGQLYEYNQSIPSYSNQLDTLANSLSANLNEIQATGLGTSGPLTSTQGTVSVADPTAPLATQNLPSTVQAGQLVVSVTDSSGNRTNTSISIDPSTDSLQDVATELNGVTGLQASVDPTTNTLKISAQSGYSFDFAGRDTVPASGASVSNPDSSGILAGLGVNGLFTGTGAANIAVNPNITANPGLLASSQSGDSGDETNLERMAAVQNQSLIGGQTLSGAYTGLLTSVGSNIAQLTDLQTSQTGVVTNLTTQDQSVTGVDQNQELVSLLGVQQGITAVAQYMSAVNTALGSILQIIQ